MTTYTTNAPYSASRPASRPSFWNWLTAILAVRRQRKALAGMEPHLLNDIGLTREAAEREANRKLWDVPQHWLR